MANVQLIKAVSEGKELLKDRWCVPLNLVWLGTYLKQYGHRVEILDGQILSTEEIIEKIYAPLVGISFDITSTESLDKIAKAAKEKGAAVVVGGQAATPLATQLLKNNPDIDIVVKYDGEESIEGLARNIDDPSILIKSIPNLVYRDGDVIQETTVREIDITTLHIPDRNLPGINMDLYSRNYEIYGCEEGYNGFRVTNSYTKKGCPRKINGHGCSFCARVDTHLREKTPYQTYEEYRYLVDEFGVDYICDDSDSWISKPWLRKLADLYNKGSEIPVKLRIYGDVRDIDPESAYLMKQVNVDAVLLGIESGDEDILIMNHKTQKIGTVIQAGELLAKQNIAVADAYVLGLIGENQQSIQRTIDLAERFKKISETQITYWNIILPLPGSRIWDEMLTIPILAAKYFECYKFDIEELRRDYIQYFCNLGHNGYDFLMEVRNSMIKECQIPVAEYLR